MGDHLLYLLLNPGKAEGSGLLHRRELDGGLPELQDDVLDENEPPSFSAEEFVEPGRCPFTKVQDRCSLERILPDVVDLGHIRRHLGTGPARRLFEKLVLEVIHSHRAEVRSSEIKDLMASGGPFALKQGHLVIPIEMVLIRPVAELYALEELILDVRIAGRSEERGVPVHARKDSVLDCPGLDVSGPARDAGHPEPAFINGAFGIAKRRHTAVRPGKRLGAIVGGEDENGVVRLAHIIHCFHERTDTNRPFPPLRLPLAQSWCRHSSWPCIWARERSRRGSARRYARGRTACRQPLPSS